MNPLSARRYVLTLSLWAGLLLALVAISPGIGTQPIGVLEAWGALWAGDPNSPHYDVHNIAFHLRMPRTIKALMAGATLALSGVVFQTLFRNPLATPYTLGIASGGTLGAMLAFKAGLLGSFLGLTALQLCAFAGALAVVGTVLGLARSSAGVAGNTLLLAGVTIGFFCSAMMMFVTYMADVTETFAIVRWMMGSVDTVGSEAFLPLLWVLVPCWGFLVIQAPALAQYELGDEMAAGRGVNPARLQGVCILVASTATAMVVSVCGPIGFVGLIVPHIVALLVGHDKRLLLPSAALAGAAFLIVCDWLTGVLPQWYGDIAGRELTAARLPIGVMTALIGAPLFLVLLKRRLR